MKRTALALIPISALRTEQAGEVMVTLRIENSVALELAVPVLLRSVH